MARGRNVKAINLALQGGGAHGAFTWGVLDRLFEDERLEIAALSGTSAGAMNAAVAAQGYHQKGRDGARRALGAFWSAIAAAGKASPLRRSPFDMATGSWSLDHSPAYLWLDLLQRLASPYDLNPLKLNPLRDLLEKTVDFPAVRACDEMQLFITATNIETGRARVFTHSELTADVIMASAALPFMFHAVEIDGQHYWDGGYVGNPALFPFYEHCETDDIVIVQINPVYRPGVPKSAHEIMSRVNEITFNSALMKELRAFHLLTDLLERHEIPEANRRAMHIHMIEARKRMRPLGASSKLNTEWAFLQHLRDIGRDAAGSWIERNFEAIGLRSTLDIPAMFGKPSDPTLRPARADTSDEEGDAPPC